MAARTKFFDEQTEMAVDRGMRQVVILGAGYDGRAMRFAFPGVQFFEVDHPDTQEDKRRRVHEIGGDVTSVRFVAGDLAHDDVSELLHAAGFDESTATLFLCEGLLPYLTEDQDERLLRAACRLAAPGSALAVNFHVRPPSSALRDKLVRGAVDAILTLIGEPRRCEFGPGDPAALLARSGWHVDIAVKADHEAHHGYGLFVRALPSD
jgi:methyltransferase (TIGR00027 family)